MRELNPDPTRLWIADWRRLTQLAIAIGGIVSGFLIPPPIGSERPTFVSLSEFMLVICLGLLVILAKRWHLRADIKRWIWLTTTSCVVAIVVFFLYRYFVLSWTCSYFGTPVVIGTQYTPAGMTYRTKNPEVDCATMVEAFTGETEEAWVNSGIVRRRLTLAAVYASCLPLFGTSIIGLLRALLLAEPRTRKNT